MIIRILIHWVHIIFRFQKLSNKSYIWVYFGWNLNYSGLKENSYENTVKELFRSELWETTNAWKDVGNQHQGKGNERIDYNGKSTVRILPTVPLSSESDERLMRCMCCFPESIYAIRMILVRLSAHPSLSTTSWATDEVYKPNRVFSFRLFGIKTLLKNLRFPNILPWSSHLLKYY